MGYMNLIAKECVEIGKQKGFVLHTDITNAEDVKWYLGTVIAGIHSEATEMYEALRLNDIKHIAKEGIDVIIRTLELLHCLKDVDIDLEIRKKIEINRKRSNMHGGRIL